MRDTSLNQETDAAFKKVNEMQQQENPCKKREVRNTKQFPVCTHLLQLRAVETAFLYSMHSLLSRADCTMPEKKKVQWKSSLLSYHKGPGYPPNPHPHTLLPLTQSLCQQLS